MADPSSNVRQFTANGTRSRHTGYVLRDCCRNRASISGRHGSRSVESGRLHASPRTGVTGHLLSSWHLLVHHTRISGQDGETSKRWPAGYMGGSSCESCHRLDYFGQVEHKSAKVADYEKNRWSAIGFLKKGPATRNETSRRRLWVDGKSWSRVGIHIREKVSPIRDCQRLNVTWSMRPLRLYAICALGNSNLVVYTLLPEFPRIRNPRRVVIPMLLKSSNGIGRCLEENSVARYDSRQV